MIPLLTQTQFKFNRFKYISCFGIGVSFFLLYSCHAKIKICNKMIWEIYNRRCSIQNDDNDDANNNANIEDNYAYCIK